MYKHITKITLTILTLFLTTPGYAVPISTTDGVINTTAGTASYGEVGSYVSGGTGLTGTGGLWPRDAGDGQANVFQEASNIDKYWLQYSSSAVGGPGAGSIIYSFNNATQNILAVAGVDHTPVPYEALEFILWGWDNTSSTWEEGVITAIFDDGAIGGGWTADDLSSVWTFDNAYTRFAVSGGTHYTGPSGGPLRGGEGEIDGIAAYNVPAPSVIALFSIGLVGIGFTRRRRQEQ